MMEVSVGVRVKEIKGGGEGEGAPPARMVRRAGGMSEVGVSWMMERGVERKESSRAGLLRSRMVEDIAAGGRMGVQSRSQRLQRCKLLTDNCRELERSRETSSEQWKAGEQEEQYLEALQDKRYGISARYKIEVLQTSASLPYPPDTCFFLSLLTLLHLLRSIALPCD